MRMEQRAVLGQRQSLKQQQKLTPAIIQSIEVLQMATQDLEAKLQKELVDNPALEVDEVDRLMLERGMPEYEPATDTRGEGEGGEGDRLERDLEFLERYNDDFRDWAPKSATTADFGDEDAKQEALNNSPDNRESLEEHLRRQLAVIDMDDQVRVIAELIVQSLDDRGFLPVDVVQLLPATAGEEEWDDAKTALRIVQGLDPLGVAARNTAESLLLQIDESDIDYDLYRNVLINHWDDLLRNKLPKIAKETDHSVEDIKFVVEQIATLSPYPGREFISTPAQVITPDLAIEESFDSPGEFQIRMIDDHVPRVRVSDAYRRLLQEANDKETVSYLKDKIEGAKALVEAVQQRQSTLERVAKVILDRQRDFMELGVSGLKPLKMQEVADVVGVHVSTISRAVADKYAETPQGTYPLKFFFVGATETTDGEDTSRNAVKEELKQIVDGEDKSKPLSDIAIAKMLTQSSGIKIARRTVAKYRDQLAIPDSRQRKEY